MSTMDEELDLPDRKQGLFESKPPPKGMVAKPVAPADQSDFAEMVDHMADQSWDYLYREGWFRGGENLARDIIQQEALKELDSEREFDGIYLPMLYCYRHYLEVLLKHCIKSFNRLSGIEIKNNLQQEHGLMQLWNEVRRQARGAFGETEGDANDTDKNVERLISEFHQFDPRSQTFRYRRDTQGRPQEESIPSMDLEKLVKVMRGLRNYLHCCEDKVWQMENSTPD